MRQLLLGIFLVAGLYGKESFVLIGNRDFPVAHLTEQQVRQIYLKRMRFIGGKSLVPINYTASDPLRDRFERKVMKMSRKQLKRYWAQEHYLGRRPPIVQSSVESVIAFVREVEGAVAYIPERELPGDFRVLYNEKEAP